MNQMHRIQLKAQEAAKSFLPDFASILIVDDQRFDRLRLRRLFEAMDLDTHIVEAESLESMGTALELDTFDLVVLDYTLTDGNGFDAIEAIRLCRKNRLVATIMVTGTNQFQVATEALRQGCSDYIVKDELSPETLQRAMINALQKSSLRVGMENQEKIRQNVELVLEQFAQECLLEIKPMLSRMMRQLRTLKTAVPVCSDHFDAEHATFERSCMRLWEFLEDLEGYSKSNDAAVVPPDKPQPPATSQDCDHADAQAPRTAVPQQPDSGTELPPATIADASKNGAGHKLPRVSLFRRD